MKQAEHHPSPTPPRSPWVCLNRTRGPLTGLLTTSAWAAVIEAVFCWVQEDKKSGGGFMGTVKSLLVGGGNGNESQTSMTNTNVSASHSKGSQTATSGSSATQEYHSSNISSKEYHSTNTYAVDTKV